MERGDETSQGWCTTAKGNNSTECTTFWGQSADILNISGQSSV